MINPRGKSLAKLLFGMFDDAIQGVDRYNHNGCLWLIFTDEMRWVVEYTNGQTLWYNYYFFKNEMEMVGLDCVEDKDLIQKWFESRFLNIDPVEYTIQNGVKETKISRFFSVDVKDTIQNGVKENCKSESTKSISLRSAIQNGVKHCEDGDWLDGDKRFEDIIQNGEKK